MFLLSLAAVAVYANSLRNPMMLDDNTFFNETMRSFKFAYLQLVPDKNTFLGVKDQKEDVYYRPLAHIIPMMAYIGFGDNVVGHHVLNLVLFVLAAFLLMRFVLELSGDMRVAFLAALAYIVHPINGIIVNYITASVFAAEVIFMLLALLALGDRFREKRNSIFLYLPCSFFFLAILCHEAAMALPFYAAVFIMILNRHLPAKEYIQLAFKHTFPMWLLLVCYFVFRLNFSSLSHSVMGNFGKFHMDFGQYLASLFKLIVWYVTRLFYPFGIVIIKPIDVVRGAFPIFGWTILGLGLVALAGFLLWSYRRRPVPFLGLLFLCIGFGPVIEGVLFLPIHGPVLEPHWLVFPVIGFFIWFAALMVDCWDHLKKWLMAGVMAVILSCWVVSSWGMNAIWSNEMGYYYYWLSQAPGYAAVMFYLGQGYAMHHNLGPARFWYNKALEKNYWVDMTLTNLGLVDIMGKNWGRARQYLNEALKVNPYIVAVYANLGTMDYFEGKYALSKEHFFKAMDIDQHALLPRVNLAGVLQKMGDIDGAIRAYEDILVLIPPPTEDVLTNLLGLYWKKKDKANVLKRAKQLIGISKKSKTLTEAGMMLQSLGRLDLARQAYQKAVRADPAYAKAEQMLRQME